MLLCNKLQTHFQFLFDIYSQYEWRLKTHRWSDVVCGWTMSTHVEFLGRFYCCFVYAAHELIIRIREDVGDPIPHTLTLSSAADVGSLVGRFSECEAIFLNFWESTLCNTSTYGAWPEEQCVKCYSNNDRTQEWAARAVNMRSVSDSCQPSATLGRKSETEKAQEPECWHESCCTRRIIFFYGVIHESSIQFLLHPVLALFH